MHFSTRTFIAALWVLTIALFLITLPYSAAPSTSTLAMALIFSLSMAIATLFPLHFDYRTRVVLDTGVIFTAILLLDPAIAMVAIGLGAYAGNTVRRRDGQELLFNTAQIMLQAGVAAQILAWSGWSIDIGNMQLSSFIALVLAAGTVYLLNTLLVSVIIALQAGLPILQVWLKSTTRNDTVEQISQFVLGLLAAHLVVSAAWVLPLLLFPALVIYFSLARWMHLRTETVGALEALADLVDMRDPYTFNHSQRVAAFAREIATELGCDYEDIELVEQAGRVHDLGKIIIDPALLAKPGRLSDSEWVNFHQHPASGADILAKFPDFASGTALVRSHHERVDGTGYPDRLSGDEIPLGARILAVADAFDAMASARPYRRALPNEVILAEFQRGRGSQWDANVVDSLIRLIEQGRIVLRGYSEHAHIVDGSGKIIKFDSPAPPVPDEAIVA